MTSPSLAGKGAYLYVVSYIEGANQNVIWAAGASERLAHAERVADAAVAAGLTHVLIKVADGIYPYNVRRKNADGKVIFNSTLPDAVDDCPAVIAALQRRGILVFGWQFVYGINPAAEAAMAIRRMRELGLDGWVVNAETHWKTYYQKEVTETVFDKKKRPVKTKVMLTFENDKPPVATLKKVAEHMEPVRAETTRLRIPLFFSGFKFPSSHPSFPFAAFLDYCEGNMPQVYPVADTRTNAHSLQLAQSLAEYRKIAPGQQIFPTGAACNHPYTQEGRNRDWLATPAQVTDFFQAAVREGLDAASIWEWDQAARRHPELWRAMAEFKWPGSQPDPVIEVAPNGAGDPMPIEDGWMARFRKLVSTP